MPETPADVVRTYYERVDAEDVDGLVALFAPDAVYERPGQDRLEGREELDRFYREGRPLSEGSHELHALVHDESGVATRGTFNGRQDGERVSLGFADFFTFDEDGLIETRHTYTDRDTV